MTTLEKCPHIKETTMQLVAFLIMFTLKKNYKLLTMDLSKQKTLNADSKAIQQINFTGNLVGSIQQYSSLLRNSEKDY